MIPLFKTNISPHAKEEVSKVLESGMIGEGPRVKAFTAILSEITNQDNIIPLNSCTSALTLALRLATKGQKGRVISPTFTFPATNTAIKDNGLDIIFSKTDPKTLCSSVDDIIDLIFSLKSIKAIVLTLVGGLIPADFDRLYTITKDYKIPLILDAAHALTTHYKGKHISHWADFTCFSFQAIKHLTTGDGGALICNNNEDFELANRLKWFGMDRNVPSGKTRLEHQMEYSIPDWGYKYHMNDISAAIGLANIDRAMSAIGRSEGNANCYNERFKDALDIQTLFISDRSTADWWVYGFTVPPNKQWKLIDALNNKGIQSSPLWKLNHTHDCFNNFRPDSDLNFVDYAPVFIPNGYWVTEEQRERIADLVIKLNKEI